MPVSDLRNYNEVLKHVSGSEAVFLTRNGRGSYVVLDIAEYERLRAMVSLSNEIWNGERSAEEGGWVEFSDLEAELEIGE
jgi:prevent-host-death family protein